MKISVIGCGYVGLVTGACLSEIGHHVICTDNDDSKIQALNQGKLPIFEPDLDVLVERNVKEGRLKFYRYARLRPSVKAMWYSFVSAPLRSKMATPT